MGLTPGSRLGPYEVTALLGEGGMGQVYRATDTHLKRHVAIKVLPASVAGDVDRLARFQREAEVLAALNHPNIAAIYGLEKTTDVTGLVMELVEGADLSQRLARGAIPLDEALPIARQIAEALEAAHEQGIVHRDLKPANIKVRDDGTVKVLDFGLAKAMDQAAPASGEAMQAATITTPAHLRQGYGGQAMTQTGMILGTAPYMSPEQARGKAVDKRADIWAFGCVFYEMLTGRRLFAGDTVSDTLAAVLTREPDFTSLPGGLPAHVRMMLARCLERDATRRLRDVGEARLALDPHYQAAISHQLPGAEPASRRRQRWLSLALAGVVAVIAVVAAAGRPWLEQGVAAPGPIVLQELPPPGTEFVVAPLPSPDGTHLAMLVRSDDGRTSVWVRRLDTEAARRIDGTDDATLVFWSPDSMQIAFHVGEQLQRVPRDGGRAQVIASVDPGNRARGHRIAAWFPGGDILIAATQGLVRVPAGGGTPRPILQAEGVLYDGINVLGDAGHLLYAEFGGAPGIYTAAIDGSDRRVLLAGEVSAVSLVSPGTVVFQRRETLFGLRIDPGARSPIGDPFPLADGVGAQLFEGSAAGVLTYLRVALQTELAWFSRTGQRSGTIGGPGRYQQLALSPGGAELLFVRLDPATGNRDLWVQDLARDVTSRVTTDPETDHNGVFSPDGRQVIWESHTGGSLDLYRRPLDGATPPARILKWGRANGPVAWSPDGQHMIFASDDGVTKDNLWILRADAAAKPEQLVASPFSEDAAAYSPDGRYLAFTSDESGRTEVYVQRIEGTKMAGGRAQISSGGGTEPSWRKDGKELYYLGSGRLVAVPITTGRPTIAAGAPVPLFPASALGRTYGTTSYAASPDGQRFVFVTRVGDRTAAPATVIAHWRREGQD